MKEPAEAVCLSLKAPLDVRDIPAEGLRFDEALTPDLLGAWVGDAPSRGPVAFTLGATGRAVVDVRPVDESEPPTLRIRGRLEAPMSTACVRCLETVEVALEADLEATLVPHRDPLAEVGRGAANARGRARAVEGGEPLEAWTETFPEPEALDEDAYDGRTVPLPALLGQAFLLELPSDPACADESDCDRRTHAMIDAANADARASDAGGDPRWAALQALRARLGDRED